MEIKINSESLNAEVTSISTNAQDLKISKMVSVSSKSETLDKFIETYENLSDALAEYIKVLNDDMKNVSAAVAKMNAVDRSAGKIFGEYLP